MVAVGEAGSGSEAVALCRTCRPDVVVMDVRMPDGDGIEATRTILAGARAGRPRVLVLTTFDLDDYVYEALRAGASGFLLKNAPPRDLLAAVRVVAAGGAVLAPSVTGRLIEEVVARPPMPRAAPQALRGLTLREGEVLAHVAAGRSNAEIAEDLSVSVTTVKTHISSLLGKLGVRDRAQLVALAHRSGAAGPVSPHVPRRHR
jgi:DNA-binding NarL/FixJ family response regulator